MKTNPSFYSTSDGVHTAHLSYYAGEAGIVRHRLVKPISGTQKVALAHASDCPIGVASDTASPGELLDVALLCSPDTLLMHVKGPLQAGDIVVAADEGYAQKLPTQTGTYFQVGIALHAVIDSATIEVIPCVPVPHHVNADH